MAQNYETEQSTLTKKLAEFRRLGAVASIDEAFRTLLSPEAGHYRPPARPSLFEMLPFIRAIGAVPVLAHPFLDLSEAELIGLLPDAREAGLVGMECYYPLYDEATTATALGLARRFSLLPGGGSDYHGGNKPDIALGYGRGDLRVPYALADALRERARKAFDTTVS